MLSWTGRLLGGISLTWWLIGGLALAAAGYVGATQLVLHNRQAELDASIAQARQLAADKATLTNQLDQVQELDRRNLETLAHVRADHDRALADVAADLARARKARMQLTVVRMEMRATRMQAALWRTSALCSIAISTARTTPESPPPRVVTEIEWVEMRQSDALLVCDQDLLPPPRPDGPAGARLPR